MSEFTFPCPVCRHDVLCDTALVGKDINCPTCKAVIVVPDETAGAAMPSAQTGTPPAAPDNASPAVRPTSGLAIASLVCSVLSLITCVGWLPGIICGHLAKSRIRRNPSLKGGGLATAGLIIGYSFLVLEVGTAAVHVWRFSRAVKQGYETVRQDLATNNVIVTQIQTTNNSNENQQAEPAQEPATPGPAPATSPPSVADESLWTSNITAVSFPGHPVSGKVQGTNFVLKAAMFRNGGLRMRSADGLQLDVYHLEKTLEARSYEIQPDDENQSGPRVKMTWKEAGATQSATYDRGYAMKLQFDQPTKRTVTGEIYLCFPDDSKSCVAGTFKLRLPVQKK